VRSPQPSRDSIRAIARSHSVSPTEPCSGARTLDFGIEQLGKRPVRKLDRSGQGLRCGSVRYQLAFTDQAEHAVVNDTVELVRTSGLERAVPFTNAVMRRLAQGFNGLVASLPEGPVKESYPDWIAETWTRDFGNETALALMRAQNERPHSRCARPSPSANRPMCRGPTSSSGSTSSACAR